MHAFFRRALVSYGDPLADSPSLIVRPQMFQSFHLHGRRMYIGIHSCIPMCLISLRIIFWRMFVITSRQQMLFHQKLSACIVRWLRSFWWFQKKLPMYKMNFEKSKVCQPIAYHENPLQKLKKKSLILIDLKY